MSQSGTITHNLQAEDILPLRGEVARSAGGGSHIVEASATIGTFDGVHRGHRYLLKQLRSLAQEQGLATLALTFRQHPAVTLGHAAPPQLCTLEEKVEHLGQEVDHVEVLDFSSEMAALTAREFMQLLHDTYGVRLLLLGHDHRFGRPTDHDDYERDGREVGIDVQRALPLPGICSTAIRKALISGDLIAANTMLGRPYRLSGSVVHGRHMGHTIGFPTANLNTPLLLPKSGVYAVRVTGADLAGVPALLNIGHRPTLDNGSDVTVEVHIPHFSGDLYGASLHVDLMRYLRPEQSFPSLAALRTQIEDDLLALNSLLPL